MSQRHSIAYFAGRVVLLIFLGLLLEIFATPARNAVGQTYSLQVSNTADRANPAPLAGKTVVGNIYVFMSPQTGITRVRFFLDNPSMSGAPRQVESIAPYDFAGTAADNSATPFNTTQIADGPHTITAAVDLAAGGTEVVNATFTVANIAPATYNLLVSTAASRSNPVPLQGQTLVGNRYIFVTPESGIMRVRFFLDNPSMSGAPRQVESVAPYDFAGTAADNSATPFNTTQIADGPHTITAAVDLAAGGTEVVNATFTVANIASALAWNPSSISFTVAQGGTTPAQTVNLTTNNGTAASFTVSENAPWLTVSPTTGTTPATVTFTVNATGLAPNTYTTTVTASASGYVAAGLTVTLTVGNQGGCSPLPCSEILVSLPYSLNFSQSHGKIPDKNNVGTGFTYVDAPSNGTGYLPANLSVNTTAGTLQITTTAGLASAAANSLDNALAVGIDAPSQISIITTTLLNPPAGTGNFEQAGLWFGNDEDNYVKLVVISTPSGTTIQYLMEQAGAHTSTTGTNPLALTNSKVVLTLFANPSDRTIIGTYQIDGGPEQTLETFIAPGEFFSFDAAGIDPEIGTRSFGGIFASHRNGPGPLVYSFDDFSVAAGEPPDPEPTGFTFNRTSHSVPNPTSMAWGPDNRLYVTELFGTMHALTFNQNKQVIADEVITTLGSRLTLGITVDPLSTPTDVVLWVSHSSPSLDNGAPNSGIISRLSGIGFTVRQDVITGLPRAIANHATNSLHFGPDGKLYIVQGGNSGAGAPNTGNTEFGTMQEQPLSAALLVADVRSPSFDGSCHNPNDIFGPPPCDVVPYATGLRNSYDFVFHSNGRIYAPDNGLGVVGTYPPTPVPSCLGFGDVNSHNPGLQPDVLSVIVQGGYYGHPNPHRNECVFKDGSFQGVAPMPNWVPPILNLGNNRSANGTIEYTSGAFCNALQGSILIANYSIGDDIVRVKLSPDGLSVSQASTLVGGFNDPLPLALGPDGTIYVGELGGNLVTALVPNSNGCWTTKQSLPVAILDVGGTAVNGKLYIVGGKTSVSHVSTLYIYDPVANSWSVGPNLPGPAVENPAVAALNSKLYVFGGSTQPFSGAIPNSAVYDPVTNSWTSLAPMSTGRGGPTAQAINGMIYVVGGMDVNGASLAIGEVYNPATNSWSTITPMSTRRDNPGSAVLNGNIYVFGGRTRNADGSTINGTLNTVEMYNPGSNSWTARAPMPTGRRTMVVGSFGGRAQVIGGEITAAGGAFDQNEEYDPVTDTWRSLLPMLTARQGAAAGTINNSVYIVGGGTVGGSSFSNVNEAFTFNQ